MATRTTASGSARNADSRILLVKLRSPERRSGARAIRRTTDEGPMQAVLGEHPAAVVQPLFASRAKRRTRRAERATFGLRGGDATDDDDLFLELRLPRGVSRQRVMDRLQADSRVDYVEPPPVRRVPLVPRRSVLGLSDPGAKHQWYLGAVGFPTLWERTSGLRWPSIAMLDQGVHRHQDLDVGGRIDIDTAAQHPQERHGTMVVGVLAAEADNGIGIAGASRSRVIAFRVMNHSALSYKAYFAALRACENDRIRVINISMFGGDANRIEAELIGRCMARGSIVVAAAGNHGTSARSYPASIPGVIGVGAVDSSDGVWPGSGRGTNVWIAAPGVRMLTTAPKDDYDSPPGTSFAAPLVSAAVAGLFALRPTATRDEVIAALRRLTRLGGAQRDPDIGYGILDLRGV